MAVQRLSQGGVQGVDRAVPLGHLVAHLAADAELDRGFGRRLRRRASVSTLTWIVEPLEMRLERAGALLDQQVERAFGRLELVALVFQLDDLRQNLVHQLAVVAADCASLVRATMFERPDSSLTRMRRSLPTRSGAMCS